MPKNPKSVRLEHPDIELIRKITASHVKNMNDAPLWFALALFGHRDPEFGPGGAYYVFKTEEEARIQLEKLKEEFGSDKYYYKIDQRNVLCNDEYYFDKYDHIQKIGKRV